MLSAIIIPGCNDLSERDETPVCPPTATKFVYTLRGVVLIKRRSIGRKMMAGLLSEYAQFLPAAKLPIYKHKGLAALLGEVKAIWFSWPIEAIIDDRPLGFKYLNDLVVLRHRLIPNTYR